MAINVSYQPVAATFGLAQDVANNRNSQQQADRQLRLMGMGLDAQLTREGRAQALYQQQLNDDNALQRMMMGAGIRQQENNWQNQANLQRFNLENQATNQRFGMNQDFQAKQQSEAERIADERQQMMIGAQQAQDLQRQAAERAEFERREAARSFQSNVMDRLKPEGQQQYQNIQNQRAALERARAGGSSDVQVSDEFYLKEMQRLDGETQLLNDPKYVLEHGQKTGDVVEKDGAYYTTDQHGQPKFSGIKDAFQYAKSQNSPVQYVNGEVASMDYTLPNGQSVKYRTPLGEEVEAERKQYAAEWVSYETRVSNHSEKIADAATAIMKASGADGAVPMSFDEAFAQAEQQLARLTPQPPAWQPRGFSSKAEERTGFTREDAARRRAEEAAANQRSVDPQTGRIKNPNVLDDMRQFDAVLNMQIRNLFPEAPNDEARNEIAANLQYPQSQEERDAIPSGEFYVSPEGYIYKKK